MQEWECALSSSMYSTYVCNDCLSQNLVHLVILERHCSKILNFLSSKSLNISFLCLISTISQIFQPWCHRFTIFVVSTGHIPHRSQKFPDFEFKIDTITLPPKKIYNSTNYNPKMAKQWITAKKLLTKIHLPSNKPLWWKTHINTFKCCVKNVT